MERAGISKDQSLPPVGAATALGSAASWRALFEPYSHIVLVGNSDATDVQALIKAFPEKTLFVFFNKVYKVLDRPFTGHAMLVSRGQPKGANIVYRNEVDEVLAFFAEAHFLGIMNIRLSPTEKFNTSSDYRGAATGHLDLIGFCDAFYTDGKTPTSGFALALWLAEIQIPSTIVLAGFSAKRSEKWRVVSVHDWNLEQTILRLFARVGKVVISGGVSLNPYEKLAQRFPDISSAEIALAAAEVLSERLSNTDAQVDKLISLTGILRSGDNFLRGLKPRLLRKPKK